ncbi:hypothetical protein WJX74_004124 [Apatococcus lobatus]|uniref:HIT-type domain-containing protein n=1 Tax=Apatococcus lobatus TaxID=904363 RepID=A0AAW1RTB2_9CHLO
MEAPSVIEPVSEQRESSAGPSPCGACGESAPKYTCPACSARSCSAACCQRHKAETGCTGKRSRSSLVSLTEFNDRELISDYRFLEEVGRVGEAAFRGRPEGTGNAPPERVRSLLKAAGLRHVDLRLQMPGMTRRRANTSNYDHKRRQLTWCLGWQFPAANLHIFDREVDEHAKAADLLQAHLSLDLATLRKGLGERAAALEPYRAAGVDKLQIVMKAAFCQASQPVYHHIAGTVPLSSQLAQKTVIEYPELTVVLPSEQCTYALHEVSSILQLPSSAQTEKSQP